MYRIGFTIALIFLFVSLAACNNIVKIVPLDTPTPAAVAQLPVQADAPTNEASPPTRIVAQTIDLDSPVVEMGWHVVERWGQQVTEWNMPDENAAWHRNSARPGEGSNIVISGHNASTGSQVFAQLDDLQVGDEITIWSDAPEPFVYQIIDKTIIRTFAISDEADAYLRNVTEPTASEQLTLVTCWPNWTNTHRLIVIAEPKL